MSPDPALTLLWLFRTVVGGSVLLLLVWMASRWVEQPTRRQRLAETGIAAALIIAILAVLPGWIPVQLPIPQTSVPVSNHDGIETAAEPTERFANNEVPAWWHPGGGMGTDDNEETAAGALLPADTYLAGFGGPNLRHPIEPAELDESFIPKSAVLPTAEQPPSFPWESVVPNVLVGYSVGAAAVACYWLMGLFAVWRMLRTAVQPSRRVCRQFNEMCRPMRRRPRVLASRKLRVPVSCGIWRPTVVLPANLCRREHKARLRWVFAHELTHLRRGDAWSRILLGLGGMVYFFCPWFWKMRRQIGLCQEYIADSAAVSHDARHEDYAQFLLGLASAPAGPALAMSVRGTASDLFRRVTMLLQNPIRVERRCGRLWWVGTAMSLLAVAVFVSGIGAAPDKKPTTDEKRAVLAEDDPDPAEDEKKPAKPEKRKEELKRKVERKGMNPDDFPFDELRKALENLPDRVDVDQIEKEVRKALKQIKERHGVEFKEDVVRKHAAEALKNLDDNKDMLRKQIEEAMKSVEGINIDNEKLQKQIQDALGKAQLQFRDNQFTDDGRRVLRGAFPDNFDGGAAFTSSGGHGRLGVMVETPSAALREQLDLPKGRGLVITQLIANSAAAKAGIKGHDIFMEWDGKPVTDNIQDFQKLVEKLEANAKVDAVVLRKGKSEKIKGIIVSEATPRTGAGGRGAIGGVGRVGGGAGVGGFPGQPGFGPGAGGGGVMFGGGPGSIMTTVSRTNERVTARHQEGNLVISLTGTVADGKAKMSEIHVQDGGKGDKYDSVNDVPERYRDKVKNLVDMCEKGSVKIDVKSPRDRRSRDRDEDKDDIR